MSDKIRVTLHGGTVEVITTCASCSRELRAESGLPVGLRLTAFSALMAGFSQDFFIGGNSVICERCTPKLLRRANGN